MSTQPDRERALEIARRFAWLTSNNGIIDRLADAMLEFAAAEVELAAQVREKQGIEYAKSLEAALTEINRELEWSRKRLVAVIEHSWRVVHLPSHKWGPWHVWEPGDPSEQRVHVASGPTPEAAIDAAIAAVEGK